MSTDNFPSGLTFKDIKISGNSDESFSGKLAYKEWPETELKKVALKRTTKISGTIALVLIPGFLIPLVHFGIAVLFIANIGVAVWLYGKYLSEKSTIFYADGKCPSCSKDGRLRPYINTQVAASMVLQCPDCGQTSTATPV